MSIAAKPLCTQKPSRSPRRAVSAVVILLSLIAVIAIRIGTERKHANDLLKYADMDEATNLLNPMLTRVSEHNRPAISFQYLNSESSGMRYAAVDSLEYERAGGIADALQHAFLDSSTEVRKRALDLLPKFDPERGLRLHIAALQDEDCWIRDHAVLLLAADARRPKQYTDKRAVPILMKTLSDSDPNLAPLAIPVLMKLTGISGKDWRYSVLDSDSDKAKVNARWLTWWAAHRASWPAKEFESIGPVVPTRADPAPNFHVKDINGNRISLDDLKGKVVLLNFWGTWCPPCSGEIPALVTLDSTYRERGLQIIGVAVKEKSAAFLRNWCDKHGAKYPQILDSESIAHIYGDCFEVPVSVLIDKKGMIRRRWDGERDYDTFRLAVERLLKE